MVDRLGHRILAFQVDERRVLRDAFGELLHLRGVQRRAEEQRLQPATRAAALGQLGVQLHDR
eukprot:6486523-Prymnesium_polylepis.1